MSCPYCGSSNVEKKRGHWVCLDCGTEWGGSCRKDKLPILRELIRRHSVCG